MKKWDRLWDVSRKVAQYYDYLQGKINDYLKAYEKIVKNIIINIFNKDAYYESNKLFDIWQYIQGQLAMLEFKYNMVNSKNYGA